MSAIVSDNRKVNGFKHGAYYHPLYKVWTKIKDRLYNPNHEAYQYYGGSGVTMCDEWKNNAPAFIDWALANGWKSGLNIDKDKIPFELGIPAKIYSPEMCSVLTSAENNKYAKYNTWYEYNGRKMILKDWADELGMDYATLHHRIFLSKYSIERAFTQPVGFGRNRLFKHNGELLSIKEWAKKLRVSKSTIQRRVNDGWTIQDIINKYVNK